MRSISQEEWLKQAALQREMVALVTRFLSGAASREELETWARSLARMHESQAGRVFTHSPCADSLHTSLYNISDMVPGSEELVVRPIDLEASLRELRTGEVRADAVRVADLKLSLAEVTRRTGELAVRCCLDGFGWVASVRFASPVTGQPYVATCPLKTVADDRLSVEVLRGAGPSSELARMVTDLFDTLGIDSEDTTWLTAEPTRRFDLMRLDDNNNTALVASFTGYVKAAAHLARFEARMHKQTYWLVEQTVVPGPTSTSQGPRLCAT